MQAEQVAHRRMNKYIKALNKKCVHKSPQDKPCEGCKKSDVPYEMSKEQRVTNTKYICDLIIKFERR